MWNAAVVADYFNSEPDISKTPPIRLGAKPLAVGTVGLDSSDQDVLCFGSASGIVAYRNGIVVTNDQNDVSHHFISEIYLQSVLPTLKTEAGLRLRLAMEQVRRFKTGHRPSYSSLEKPWPLIRPRAIAALEREIKDYQTIDSFLDSVYARPNLLFMKDGRMNAQLYPGSSAYDRLYRKMVMRLVRGVGIAKTSKILEVVRPLARANRKRLGDQPFAFEIRQEHLDEAYSGESEIPSFRETLRHGSSSQALGGAGALRFALSISGDELCLVEFNLYDLEYFRPLVVRGETLEQWAQQTFGAKKQAIYSWDIAERVTTDDWERLIIPTLEEIVYAAYTDTEIGLYPRALANVHNRVKLRHADLEPTRRQLIVELASQGIDMERIITSPEDPHKTDPEVFNFVRE